MLLITYLGAMIIFYYIPLKPCYKFIRFRFRFCTLRCSYRRIFPSGALIKCSVDRIYNGIVQNDMIYHYSGFDFVHSRRTILLRKPSLLRVINHVFSFFFFHTTVGHNVTADSY